MTPPEIWIVQTKGGSDELLLGVFATPRNAELKYGNDDSVGIYRYVLDQWTREYKWEHDPS